MPRAVQEASLGRPGASQPAVEILPFAGVASPSRWTTSAVVIAAGGLGVLFLLNTLFWFLLKAAAALAVVFLLIRRFGGGGLAQSGSDALRAVATAPPHWIAAVALLVAGYGFAGTAGFLVTAGVCIGVYARARLIDWP